MKYINKTLLLSLIISSTIPNTIQALPISSISDTFTHKNVDNIYVLVGSAEYMISGDNGIMGRGANVYGISATGPVSTTTWKPIMKTSLGDLFDDVLGLHLSSEKTLYIRTNDGEVYSLGGKNYIPQLVSTDNDEYLYGMTSNTDGSGRIFSQVSKSSLEEWGYHTRAGIPRTKHTFERDITKVATYLYSVSSSRTLGSVILTDDGNLYKTAANDSGKPTTLYQLKDTTEQPLMNIEDFVVMEDGNPTLAILTKAQKLSYFSIATKKVTPISFVKNGVHVTDDIIVQSIISNNNRNGSINVTTNLGVFRGVNNAESLNFEQGLTDINSILVEGNVAIGQDGRLYKNSSAGNFSTLVPEDFQDWQYNNPILRENTLAKFSITPKKIYDHLDKMEIQFSLVTKTPPKGFNLYYAKSSDVSNTDKWIAIEKNVDINTLNPEPYETGYVTVEGEAISGYTYKYTWDVAEGNLSNIQFIIEPIY